MKIIKLSLLTALLSILYSSNTRAQLNKGAFLMGTHFGMYDYQSQNVAPDNTEYRFWSGRLNLKNRLGYFISDNAAIGIGYDFQNSFSESQDQMEDRRYTDVTYTSRSSKNDLNQHFLRLFYRQNFRIVNNLYVFLEPSIFYSKGHENNESLYFLQDNLTNEIVINSTSYSDTDINQIGINVLPGLMYMVKPWFAVELSAGIIEYSHVENETKSFRDSQDFGNNGINKTNFERFIADLSFNTFSLGVNFYFNNSPVNSQDN